MKQVPVWHNGHNTFPPLETDSKQSVLVLSDDGQPVFYDDAEGRWLNRIMNPVVVDRWRFIQVSDLKVF